jgi:hypothetical protein
MVSTSVDGSLNTAKYPVEFNECPRDAAGGEGVVDAEELRMGCIPVAVWEADCPSDIAVFVVLAFRR